jgi:precorrin-2/cobalt-factor-2 C20-methyltransferase
MSGVEDPEKLGELLDKTDNVAILKTYRSFENIMNMLKKKGLAKNATLYSKVGLPDEEIHSGLETSGITKPPYLSLMIVNKNRA